MTNFFATCKEVRENLMLNPWSIVVLLAIFALLGSAGVFASSNGATLGTLDTAPMTFATATRRPEIAMALSTDAAPQATETATATPIPPTMTPIPPDTNATALAERVYTSTVAAMETAEQNDRVKQALINDGLTKTPEAQATNTARINAEQVSWQATQTALNDAKAAAEVARINAEQAAAQKAIADKAVFDARMQDVYFYGAIALTAALTLGALLIAYAVWRRVESGTVVQLAKARALAKMNNDVSKMDFTPASTVSTVRQDFRDPDGYGKVDLDANPPGDPAAFTQLCDMVASQEKTLAINEWEGKDVLYTRLTYAPVYRWLIEKRFITVENSKKVFSKAGLKYADNWLMLHPDLIPHSPSA
jgi:hypothetical protein